MKISKECHNFFEGHNGMNIENVFNEYYLDDNVSPITDFNDCHKNFKNGYHFSDICINRKNGMSTMSKIFYWEKIIIEFPVIPCIKVNY